VKITDVKITLTDNTVKHPFRWRKGLPGSGTGSVGACIEILTDEGVTGKTYSSHVACARCWSARIHC